MKEYFLNRDLLKSEFENIENPFEALKVKENIEYCLQFLKVPSSELLTMLQKEGFEADDVITTVTKFAKEQGLKVPDVLVEERHETFNKTIKAVRQAGFDGLVLIIDELWGGFCRFERYSGRLEYK